VIIGVDARELQGRPTGTGRYLRSLVRRWTEGDAGDSFIAYFNGPAPADAGLGHASILCRSLAREPVHPLRWQEGLLPAAVRRDRVEVFFSPAYTCPLRLRIPRVTAVHDLSFFSLPADFSWREALRRRVSTGLSVRASRRILACSAFTRREIASRFPEASARVRQIPLGPDEDLPPGPPRAEARARLRVEGPLLLTVGTLLNRRHLGTLIQAAALLARRFPSLVLDVVGDNRTHPRVDFDVLARSLGLARHVRLSGFVTDAGLADRYAAADVAVSLSEYEGFGLPALEAAARGVPLVLGRRPAHSEVFADAARFVDPVDAADVAAAVGQVLESPEARSDLVARGLALAARHSWARTASLTRQALAEAAGEP
jgi:glycosyltransferase involved in cell wall biosynthesis